MDSTKLIKHLQRNLTLSSNDAIGFDVDDTILFSAPGFWVGYKKYNTNNGINFTKAPGFWTEMNNEYDKFSMIKSEVANILYEHLSAQHKVYFITRRAKTKSEKLSQHLKTSLKNYFHYMKRGHITPLIDKLPDVLFSNEKSKSPLLKSLGIKVYYGDSDSDKKDAQLSKETIFVRVLRAPSFMALYDPKQNITEDEIVLENSNRIFGT